MSDRTLLILGLNALLWAAVGGLVFLARRHSGKRWVRALFGFNFGPRTDVAAMTKRELLEAAIQFATWGAVFFALLMGFALVLELAGRDRVDAMFGPLLAVFVLLVLFLAMSVVGGLYLLLRYFLRAEARGIGPAWQAGQYVTYVLERADGSWGAFALRIEGRLRDGSWAVCGDFKTAGGECEMWFRTNPKERDGEPGIAPVKESLLRWWRPDGKRPENEDPRFLVALAMNILMAGEWASARELMRGGARKAADFPCGVASVHELVTEGPGYKKHHALHPKVMLTGVACLSTDGMNNPAVATSFGTNDPAGAGTPGHEDYVDFSHPKRIPHGGFSLAYPATWILRPGVDEKNEPVPGEWIAEAGGNACFVTLAVFLFSGPAEELARERASIVARSASQPPSADVTLTPRDTAGRTLRGGGELRVADLGHADVDGVSFDGLYASPEGTRLAHVHLFGSVAKAHPARAVLRAQMERAFEDVLESFAFE